MEKTNVDTTEEPPAVLSLCTGYGGIEMGIERAIGVISILAHVEIEAFAIANLVNKMETGQMVPAPIWTDIKTFNAKIFRGYVDILTGGYPCQPFSAAGKREGSDDPRHLWPYIRKAIFGCRPKQVFLENVEGHLSLGIDKVLSDLERMGYRVEGGIFSAAEVGAPHRRKRVFILAQSQNSKCKQPVTTWRRRSRITGKSSELGNSQSSEEWRLSESPKHRKGVETGRPSGNVANTRCCGSEQPGAPLPKKSYRYAQKWPARPGEQQYDWEEPRTVANPGSEESEGVPPPERWIENSETGQSGGDWETEPRLGRTVNGAGHRVDRLRLLGNGVVPQTAEKAYRILFDKLNFNLEEL